MTFKELNLSPALMEGIDEAGFVECTPVQERTFRQVLGESRDVTVQSQTGTGKTAAFLISIFEIFSRSNGPSSRRALIVVPTRELAVQVEEETRLLGAHLPFTVGSVFGGVGYNEQERLLQQGVQIIIGTPGRLLDFASSKKLDFRQFDILILDEADRMLDMGFLPDVRRILRALPPPTERRTMLFSATLSTRVKHLAWEFMNSPVEIEIAPEHVTVDEITQELYHVAAKEKMALLLGLLNRDKPRNALIFTNMKSTAVQVAKRLTHNGMPAEFIMGDLPQRKRLALINGIKEGKIRYLVATDVAARGLHIQDLDLVVNFDIPEDPELYVHRIGRTARAGNTGKAISLACERYVYGLAAIEAFIYQKIPVLWAGDDLYARDESAGIRFSTSEVAARRGGERSGTRRATGGGHRRAATGSARRAPAPGGSAAGRGEHGKPDAPPAKEQVRSSARRGGQRSKSDERARPEAPPQEASAQIGRRPKGDASLEDRVSYYRKKYGEDFKVDPRGKVGAPQGSGRSGKGEARRPEGSSGQARSGNSGTARDSRRAADSRRGAGSAAAKGSSGVAREPSGSGSGPSSAARGPAAPTNRAPSAAKAGAAASGGGKPLKSKPNEPAAPTGERAAAGNEATTPRGLVSKLKSLFKRR